MNGRLAIATFAAALLAACAPEATPPAATPPPEAAPSASPASPPAQASAPAPSASAAAAAASGDGPTASLDGYILNLAYGNSVYNLSASSVVAVGTARELHFDQPRGAGDTQIWLMPRDVKKGVAAPVKGTGMNAVFVQIQDAAGKARNVSNNCRASGSVTYDDLPTKSGDKAKGSIDVTITCQGVKELSGPLVIKGAFSGIPLKQ